MFEFMDGVVDALEELGQAAVDGAVYCLICVVKLALIITAPVWEEHKASAGDILRERSGGV